MATPAWLTMKEAADRAGVSVSYMRRIVVQGRVHGVQRGLQWMIDPASLRQYEETRKRKHETARKKDAHQKSSPVDNMT